MKKLLLMILCCSAISLLAETKKIDEMTVVCDEETGICQIVENAPENDLKTEKSAPMLRKHIGYTGKTEFLTFLKGEKSDSLPEKASFWGMIVLALVGGLALNLTPCVLPMLPINLAIIGASGGKKGFRNGLLYGCGMAAVYGILGVLAAFAGVSFGTLNSSPAFNLSAAFVFLTMSLAMAGVFNIDPSSKLHINAAKFKLPQGMTALVMGGLSALLAGACVAPVVISVLLFAAGAGWYGCIVPFVLGIGMALPWPLAGAGLAILPKPGKFMVVLKYIFALVIFGAAVFYMTSGIKQLAQNSAQINEKDGFAALTEAETESEKSGKPVLVKFTASWCKNCHAMDKEVLKDPEVAEYIRENYILAVFPAENPKEPEIAALLEKYGIQGFPAFVILKK